MTIEKTKIPDIARQIESIPGILSLTIASLDYFADCISMTEKRGIKIVTATHVWSKEIPFVNSEEEDEKNIVTALRDMCNLILEKKSKL